MCLLNGLLMYWFRCRNLQDYMVLAEKVKKMFHEEGIHSTTIQPEFVELEVESVNSDENCILDCPTTDKGDCAANTCCGPKQVKQRKNTQTLELTDHLRATDNQALWMDNSIETASL